MHKLPQDTDRAPLELAFPEGNVVGLAKQRVPVCVSFRSAAPTAFTADVAFLDDEGRKYLLPVTGTTEASALTCCQFMSLNGDRLQFSAAEKALICPLPPPFFVVKAPGAWVRPKRCSANQHPPPRPHIYTQTHAHPHPPSHFQSTTVAFICGY